MRQGMVVVWLAVSVSAASAHGLGVQAKIADGRLRVDGYFDDDTPARNARVSITNEAGAVIAEGQTDDAGTWKSAVPSPGTYRITLRAEDEHRASTTLKVVASTAETTGPTREEFTRFPWERLLLGVAVIAALGLLVRLVRKAPSQEPT